MVIEWLKFRVEPRSREAFIKADAEIWTSALASYPGFLSKEVWINPNAQNEVTLIIRWKTRQDWKSIPQAVLDETEGRFAQRLRGTRYQMIESSEYQVRKFSNL